MGERVTFAITSIAAIGSGVAVVTVKSAFRAAVALILTLVSVAVMFLLLAAPFVAAVQVIVYAGAIVVLFLFVIAYLGERRGDATQDRLLPYQVLGWATVAALAAGGITTIMGSHLPGLWDGPQPVGDIGSPRAIGESFLHGFLVPFEATSLLLLAGAVGAVMLARRGVQMEGGR